MKKTILTAAVILALGLLLGGQTQEQMKQQTMTLPYPMKVPADVPPIEKQVKNPGYTLWDDTMTPEETKHWKSLTPEYRVARHCADKARFLLQSEDSQWHCLKLP